MSALPGTQSRRRIYLMRHGHVDYGFHQWRRGDHIPPYFRSRYAEVDYRAYHMRRPPRGYHYVRDDRGDILLVGILTGFILSAIIDQH